MEEIEVPTEHLHEEIQEKAEEQKERWTLYVALSTAMMAVLAAVAGLLALLRDELRDPGIRLRCELLGDLDRRLGERLRAPGLDRGSRPDDEVAVRVALAGERGLLIGG